MHKHNRTEKSWIAYTHTHHRISDFLFFLLNSNFKPFTKDHYLFHSHLITNESDARISINGPTVFRHCLFSSFSLCWFICFYGSNGVSEALNVCTHTHLKCIYRWAKVEWFPALKSHNVLVNGDWFDFVYTEFLSFTFRNSFKLSKWIKMFWKR